MIGISLLAFEGVIAVVLLRPAFAEPVTRRYFDFCARFAGWGSFEQQMAKDSYLAGAAMAFVIVAPISIAFFSLFVVATWLLS